MKSSDSQTRMFLKVSRMRVDAKHYDLSLFPFCIDLFIQVVQSFLCAGNIVPLSYRKNKVDAIFQKKNPKQP